MIVEDEIVGSHTEDESHDDVDNTGTVLELFGIEQEETQESEVQSDPPKDQNTEELGKKGITVKYNKEDTFIEEERVPELARKGLNYDKVEGRAKELQASLDRAARLNGYQDHSAFVADLDRLENEKEQAQKDHIEKLKQKVIDDLVYNGVDEQVAKEYAENNPLVQEARKALQERENERAEREREIKAADVRSKWDAMYADPRVLAVFPNIVEESQVFYDGKDASFFTPEMKELIAKNYDPLHAIMLAHADKFQGLAKKTTEQRIIKQQQLGLRSKVETHATPDNEQSVPPELASAFEAFGLSKETARKYMTK